MCTEEKSYMDSSKSRFLPSFSEPYADPSKRRFVPSFSVRGLRCSLSYSIPHEHPIPPPIPRPIPVVDKDGTDVHHYCAKMALEYYNKKNGKRYELVDAGCSSAFLAPGIWFHCNFKARPCRNSCEDGNEKTSTELFFAEIHDDSKL